MFDGLRSAWRALGFVSASTLAYLAAYQASSPDFRLVNFELLGLNAAEINVLLVGGFVGAGILFLALCFFFSVRQSTPTFVLKFGIFVVCGSLLGVIGYALGPSFGAILWHLLRFLHLGEPSQAHQLQPSSDTASFYSLYVVWQTGVAGLIACTLPLRSETIGTSPPTAPVSLSGFDLGATPLPIWKKLVTVSMILVVAFFAVSQVRRLKIAKAQQEERHKQIVQSTAEAPSLANLARIEPREPGRVLILEAISGHDWDGGSVTPTPPPSPQGGPPTLPPSVFYFVSYHGLPHTDPPQPVMPSFDVSVTEYPNSAWAHYSLRNYPTINASITTANSIQRVSKFGNSIYLNSAWIYPDGKRTTYFYWPSGNFAVAIRFYGPTEDVALQKYLTLYPSSL